MAVGKGEIMMVIDVETDLAFMRTLLKSTIDKEQYYLDTAHRYKSVGSGDRYAFVPCTKEGMISLQPELNNSRDIETIFTLLLVGYLDTEDYFNNIDPIYKNPVIKDIFNNLSKKYTTLADGVINKDIHHELMVQYHPENNVLHVNHV